MRCSRELDQIADINARRRRGEAVHGSTTPVVLHVVKPELPLPLDPDFVAGRISAEALVAMGYRDAWRVLRDPSPDGAPLDGTATAMTAAPLGARVSLRFHGRVRATPDQPPETVALSCVVEVTDIRAFVGGPEATAPVVGGIRHPRWGYRPFVDGTLAVGEGEGGGKRFVLSATVRVGDEELDVEAGWSLGRGPGRWRDAAGVTLTVGPTGARGVGRFGYCDAARAVIAFEPSGAHNLRDRVAAAKLMVRFLRDH